MTLNHPNPLAPLEASCKIGISGTLVLPCSARLLAIWALPGSIALRHSLLILGFLASLWVISARIRALLKPNTWPLWVFLGFYLWLLVHLFFFSQDYSAQLNELRTVWIRCLLATPIGIAMGLLLKETEKPIFSGEPSEKLASPCSSSQALKTQSNLVILLIFIGFFGTCLIGLEYYVVTVWSTHPLIHPDLLFGFYKAKPPFVICAALTPPLSFIFIVGAINRQMSVWWGMLGIFAVPAILFCEYFSNTKNGIAIFALTLTVFFINLLSKIHWTLARYIIGAIVVCFVFGVSYFGIEKHLEKNAAWPNLIANIKVGLDIDHQNHWKNRNVFPAPVNQNNMAVDGSTYERTAWFVAGARLLAENPLGYGLVHHSFGSLALAKWPEFYQPIGNLRGATHSASMDFALGLGIPSLLLLLLPLFVCWYRSLFAKGLWFSYASWTIPILSFTYLTTEANEAHFIELLFS